MAGLFLLQGAGTLVYQVFKFLQTGDWIPISVRDGVLWVSDYFRFQSLMQWLREPSSWEGAWKVIEWLPLSGTSLVLGVFFTFLAWALAGGRL